MSDKMVELDRKFSRRLKDYRAWKNGPSADRSGIEVAFGDGWLAGYEAAQAAATIAERRMEEMRAERDKWKQRAFELECEHGDLKGVLAESRAALRPSGGV
jgi:hypothetical protein